MNLTEGVEKIREGLFAFHMELGVGYKIIGQTFQEDEKCGLQEIQYLQVGKNLNFLTGINGAPNFRINGT
jgi:hypothetical protein